MREKLLADLPTVMRRVELSKDEDVAHTWFLASEGLEHWDQVLQKCLSFQITSATVERVFSKINSRLTKTQLTTMSEDSIAAYTLSMNPRKDELFQNLGGGKFEDASHENSKIDTVVIKTVQVPEIVVSALIETFSARKGSE